MNKKSTQMEIAERVESCMGLMSLGLKKGAIKRAMTIKFGCSVSSVEKTYLPRAREELLRRLNRDRGEIKSESLSFYESVLTNADARPSEKIMARKQLDKLLGLNEPQRHEITGTNGGPIQTETIHAAMAKVLTDPEAHDAASRLGSRLNGQLTPNPADDARRN